MIHCPTCDAGLRFEIETQQMACDHCGNRFDVWRINDNERFDAKGHQVFDLYVFVCPDCGAELAVNSENDAVGFCPYCGGASMLFDRVRQSWVPDGIIPFKVSKERCKHAYAREVRKRLFVSRKYRDPELIDSFRGIYMPFWEFEGKQQTPFKVQDTEILDGSSANTRIKRVYDQWYDIDYTVTGISHDASSSFDDHTSEHLAPYHDEMVKEFHPGYLSGFYAEVGDMDKEVYERYTQQRCQDFTASKLIRRVSNVKKETIQTDISLLSNVMYPVWFMSYRRKNKISYAAVNGETGKVSADLPLSPLRIVIAAIVLALALFATFYLLKDFLPSLKATYVLALCAVVSFASACLLNESCIDTVAESLRLEDQLGSSLRTSPMIVTVSLLAVIGTLLFLTDGSYSGFVRMLGFLLCVGGYLALLFVAISQIAFEFRSKKALNVGRASQLENGIIDSFAKFKVLFIILTVVIFATCGFAFYQGLSGNLDKLMCYALCVVLAVEILVHAATQIAFQTTIAERKPPQMDKRGAFYDAH